MSPQDIRGYPPPLINQTRQTDFDIRYSWKPDRSPKYNNIIYERIEYQPAIPEKFAAEIDEKTRKCTFLAEEIFIQLQKSEFKGSNLL